MSDQEKKALVQALETVACKGWQTQEELAAEVVNAHRTIQQGLMRFCVSVIGQVAASGCDGRNEAAVQLAKKIVAATTTQDRCLPRI